MTAKSAVLLAFAVAKHAMGGGKTCQPCNPNDVPLPKPKFNDVTANNGVRWPTMCVPETPEGEEEHAFTIGDWGGMGHEAETMDNRKKKRPFIKGQDKWAQHNVASIMKKVAAKVHPKYILNVGDNFYPGGIEAWCNHGGADACSYISTGQWDDVWEKVYDGPDLGKLEWWSVMGNHDWGGADTFSRAWDQQIAFTWHHDRWLMPALYWERKVQYCDFSVDYYFLETNIYDVDHPMHDPGHNMCNRPNWKGRSCESVNGPTTPENCVEFFKTMYSEQIAWLRQRLDQSTADWQIIVTHFTPQYGYDIWKDLCKKHGVDIFVSGHRHQQEVHYLEHGESWNRIDLGKTAWTVTGGGGGVTSEGNPMKENAMVQQYGFMDLVLSKEQIHIDMYSGTSQRFMRRVTVIPNPRHDDAGEPIIAAATPEVAEVATKVITDAEPPAEEDAAPMETMPRPNDFRGARLTYFDETNSSTTQRCSAMRRRVSYMKSSFQLTGAGLGADAPATLLPEQWVSSPNDPNLDFSEHSDENCFTRCGNRSGRCDFFCGVGRPCCADGSMTDAPECRNAVAFTRGGDYECVGTAHVDQKNLREPTDAGLSPPEPYSRMDRMEVQTHESPHGSSLTLNRLVIALGVVMVASGTFLLCSGGKRRRKKRQQTQGVNSDDDEPME